MGTQGIEASVLRAHGEWMGLSRRAWMAMDGWTGRWEQGSGGWGDERG